MTEIQFEQADMLKRRIASIDKLIESLSEYEYKQDPPTRHTSWHLKFDCGNKGIDIYLNEGEVLTIINALNNKKSELQFEFGRL